MIRQLLRRLRRRLPGGRPTSYWENPRYPAYWFDRLLGDGPASVVQIGSNDGKTGDPLHPLLLRNPAWRGLFVEPLPAVFARLRANYPAEDRFRFANVAVNDGSRLPFYYVTEAAKAAYPDLPEWYDQLGSFDRRHLTKHLEGRLEPFITSLDIQGVTLPDLLAEYAVDRIDLLHIDAEGYDWAILSQLDLSRYRPRLILFEYHHLGEEEVAAARRFLAPHYRLYAAGIDYLAVSREETADVHTALAHHMTTIEP